MPIQCYLAKGFVLDFLRRVRCAFQRTNFNCRRWCVKRRDAPYGFWLLDRLHERSTSIRHLLPPPYHPAQEEPNMKKRLSALLFAGMTAGVVSQTPTSKSLYNGLTFPRLCSH